MSVLKKQLMTSSGAAFMVLGIGSAAVDTAKVEQLFSTGDDVLVQVIPSVANLTSELHLFSPERRYLTTNRDTRGVINLGNFPVGSELIFGIFVRDTENIFLMGPGTRNPDGISHASVQFLRPGVAIVGFKDIWGEQNEDVGRAITKFEGAIADAAEPVPPSTASGNLVSGNFSFFKGLKRQKQHKAV